MLQCSLNLNVFTATLSLNLIGEQKVMGAAAVKKTHQALKMQKVLQY